MRLSFPFTRHPNFLIDDNILPTLDSIEIRVLLVLLRYSVGFDRLHTGSLSLATLALKSGLSHRSAQRALSLLEGRGYIQRELHPGRVSGYRISFPDLTSPAAGPGRSPKRGGDAKADSPTHVTGDMGHVEDSKKEIQRKSSCSESQQEDFSFSVQESQESHEDSLLHGPPQTSTGMKDIPIRETPPESALREAAGELTTIAEAIAEKLQGVTLRLVTPTEILPTLRTLKAESLNRRITVDLRQLVLEKVEQGIAANVRKNGGSSSIHGWSYFVKGLPDALELKAREVERQATIQAMKTSRAEEEAIREHAEEKRGAQLRAHWEQLDEQERTRVESQVISQLPGFMLQVIRRDREQGRRGPGIIALEQACFQEIANSQAAATQLQREIA